MKISKVCFAILLMLGLSSVSLAQLTDGILVQIPHEFMLGDKRIPAGEYEVRKMVNNPTPTITFFNKDEMVYETTVLPISTAKPDVEEHPKVVLHKIGDDYYLTEIWLMPDKLGYEVPLPSRVRLLERELNHAGQ